MKKSIYLFIAMVLLLNIFPTRIYASEKVPIIIENPKEVPIEVKAMFNRLDEIKAMDKSNLNSVQKKNFVKKLKQLKVN